jgi:hypothetical protein
LGCSGCGISEKHQVILDLIDRQITPLVVKNTMCSYLAISMPNAVKHYKGCVSAAKKRALDTSACTVSRSFKRSRSADAGEDDGEGAGKDAGEGDGMGALELC